MMDKNKEKIEKFRRGWGKLGKSLPKNREFLYEECFSFTIFVSEKLDQTKIKR